MANTSSDFARMVGAELGIRSPGEELEADELADIQSYSRFAHSMLRVSPKICYWDEEDIPDEVILPLVKYIASLCGKEFGKTVTDKGLDEALTRERRLKALVAVAAPRYTGSTAKALYY